MSNGPPFLVGGDGHLREFVRREVFEIVVLEGLGKPGDPFRHVTYWVLPDGRLLSRFDPKETT